jgi:hypothetical protein
MSCRSLHFGAWGVFGMLASLMACSSKEPSGAPDTGQAAASSGLGDRAGAGAVSGSSGGTDSGPELALGGSAGTPASSGSGDVCATVTASAMLEPVHLAFAFDVSGSMGKGDHPWHDATLKWDPVVAATRGFFEDPASEGLMASLTAFPIDADEDERCEAAGYADPGVAMQALPSTEFGEALTAIREHDWRGGTPTLAVVQGVLGYIATYRAEHPGHYALVLVTDGYPQGCDDDSIESVKDAVSAVASDVPTYVIGVKNPPLVDDDGDTAPDTVSNLAGVAEAGGTESPFIIDTGEPAKTSTDFQAAIEKIRGVAISCNVTLPTPPDGRAFERDSVVVKYSVGGAKIELSYDESCTVDNAWHYDDVDNPSQVVLCPATCATVTAGPEAEAEAALGVDFTCERVINLPR